MKITDKDIFNKVRDHLLKQNDRSTNQFDECQYRGYLESTLLEFTNLIAQKIEEHTDQFWDEYYDALANADCDAKCAIGAIINDEFYDDGMEGRTIESDIIQSAIKLSNPGWDIDENSIGMLEFLQSLHDKKPVLKWKTTLDIIELNFTKEGKYIYEPSN